MKRKKNVDFVRKSEKTNCYSSDVNWPKLDDSVSVVSTYFGLGSPELATVGASDKYFEMNVYPGLNPVANSTDFILGKSTIIKSVLSANKQWLNINEAISVANTYLGVDSPQLATVIASNKYFNRNVYTGVNPLETSTELIFGQNNFRASLLSDKNHWSSLDGLVPITNTYLGVGSPQLMTLSAVNKYFNSNDYSGLIPSTSSTDFILGQSSFKTSLFSDKNHWSNLDRLVSVENTYLGVGSNQLVTVGTSDKYFNSDVYTGVSPLASSTDFILGQSSFRTNLLSDKNYWSNLDGLVPVANTYLGLGSHHLTKFGISDRYINKNVYTGVNSFVTPTDFILGPNSFRTSLPSDMNNWSSHEGYKFLGSNPNLVNSSNIGHLDWHLGINNVSINSNSEIKEYGVFNIGHDYLKRENKDKESFLKKEIQKVVDIVKIVPDHLGYEITETSKNVNFNIYIVYTGSFRDNNLEIEGKNVTIINMKSKYDLSNATFNGGNIAIGDNHQNLFFSENSNENFSPIERELVSLIFENTDNDEERKELLSMLKTYRGSSENEKKTAKPIFGKKLTELGEKTGIALIAKLASEYLGGLFTTDVHSKVI